MHPLWIVAVHCNQTTYSLLFVVIEGIEEEEIPSLAKRLPLLINIALLFFLVQTLT